MFCRGIERWLRSILILSRQGGKSSIGYSVCPGSRTRGERAGRLFFYEPCRTTRMARHIPWELLRRPGVKSQHLRIEQLDAGEISPASFAWAIRQEGETAKRAVVRDCQHHGFLRFYV